MPDLLTHVLVGFTLATLLSIRYERITPALVTVAMVGATLPDLNRMELILPSPVVVITALRIYDFVQFGPMPEIVALPFAWTLMHALPAVLVVATIGSLLVAPGYRRLTFGLLVLGAVSHLTLDLFLMSPYSPSYSIFAPFTSYEPPTPGLYSSRDPWLAPVAAVFAGLAKIARDRHRDGELAGSA